MEWKIGEIKQVNGEWYQCVVAMQEGCRECSFCTQLCTHHSECMSTERSDKTSVVFKKLEKVGEPYERFLASNHSIKVQRYRLPYRYAILPTEPIMILKPNYKNYIEIQIKQNEDMDENKLNLKPFSLEAAKAGKPVCTRDGRKARIICFDRVTNTTNEYTGHLIVLVTNPNGDEQSFYYTEKGNLAGEDEYDNHKYDLMMLSEKKEGWINIYTNTAVKNSRHCGSNIYASKEEALNNISPFLGHYINTNKIEWEE